jgi:hypothetical protein
MPSYEVAIQILDKSYVDQLVAALVRQGYAVYYNDDIPAVGFTTHDDEVTELKNK